MKNYTIIQETTPGFPKHIYTLNEEGMLIAYQPYMSYRTMSFKKPLRFDLKGRSFNTIVPYDSKPTYTTSTEKCTCPGFVYRRKCKHVEALKNGLQSKQAMV